MSVCLFTHDLSLFLSISAEFVKTFSSSSQNKNSGDTRLYYHHQYISMYIYVYNDLITTCF